METNKQNIEKLIDLLPNECRCYDVCSPKFKHPILKCDVELKMLHRGVLYDESEHNGLIKFNSDLLTELWQPLGFNRSLQSIIEEDGKEARELCEFLINFF